MSHFPHMLNEVHKVTGDMVAGMICPEIAIYYVTCSTPNGSVVDAPTSIWDYLCAIPRDNTGNGWSMDILTLADHLASDPMPTLYLGAGSGRIVGWLGARMPCLGIDNDPEAIELMERRGVPCALMDATNMAFEDGEHARVVVHGDGLVDSFEDVVELLTEAARVASDVLIVTGYELDPDETVVYQWGFTWGEVEDVGTYYAHPTAKIEAALVALGMTLVSRTMWSDDEAGSRGTLFGVQYLIEARW